MKRNTKRILSVLAVLALLALLPTFAAYAAEPELPEEFLAVVQAETEITVTPVYLPDEATQQSFAAEAVRLLNAERANAGLPPLQNTNAALQNAAQVRAEESAAKFSHTRPSGQSCFTVLGDYGLSKIVQAGENIACGQATPERVVEAWMNSPGHRANMLGDFTDVGVGIYAGEYHHANGKTYLGLTWALEFIKTSPFAGTHAGALPASGPSASQRLLSQIQQFVMQLFNWMVKGWNAMLEFRR